MYFVSFTVIGSSVLLSLLIGVVVTSMEEANQAAAEANKIDNRLLARLARLGVESNSMVVECYGKIFELLCPAGEQRIERGDIKEEIIPAVYDVRKSLP